MLTLKSYTIGETKRAHGAKPPAQRRVIGGPTGTPAIATMRDRQRMKVMLEQQIYDMAQTQDVTCRVGNAIAERDATFTAGIAKTAFLRTLRELRDQGRLVEMRALQAKGAL